MLVATLLSSGGAILGTSLYYREACHPRTSDVQLIENVSHIVGIAIERHMNEEALRRSEARKAAILDSALDCIVTIVTRLHHGVQFGRGADLRLPPRQVLASV